MNAELIRECGQLINQFGFPIFFGLVMIFGGFFVLKYFIKALEKKDCDFLGYVEKRDAQVMEIVQTTNISIRENTLATNKLRASFEERTAASKVNRKVLQHVANRLDEHPPVDAEKIPMPETEI